MTAYQLMIFRDPDKIVDAGTKGEVWTFTGSGKRRDFVFQANNVGDALIPFTRGMNTQIFEGKEGCVTVFCCRGKTPAKLLSVRPISQDKLEEYRCDVLYTDLGDFIT